MFWAKLFALGIVGAIIGYITNTIAVKMIFRPLKPIKVPVLNLEIQGLIPKRRKDIARTIGDVVDKELISMEAILDQFIDNTGKDQLIERVKEKLKKAVSDNLPSLIPSMIKQMILEHANEIIDRETENFFVEALDDIMDKASLHIKIAEMVEEKINEFELEKMEALTMRIAKKELKHIEVFGGVLGFIIGIFQGLVVLNI